MLGYSDFGLKARTIMLQKGVTMVEIAKKMGVSKAYISDILKGVRGPEERRKQIAEILDMDESEVC